MRGGVHMCEKQHSRHTFASEMPGKGPGGHAPTNQVFGRPVNPNLTRGRLCPPNYCRPPRFLDGAASLRFSGKLMQCSHISFDSAIDLLYSG